MNWPVDPIALTLVPTVAFAIVAMWHFCDLTRDHKRTWIAPGLLALALAMAGTFQAAALAMGSPLDLLRYGAFYSPVALADEPWRFMTSIFIYDDPILVLFSSITVAIVGCRLVQHIGYRGLAFTFTIATLLGALLPSGFDPQSLVTGATAGCFGLVTATLLLGGWRASQQLERIARGTALAFVIVSLARLLETENMVGAFQAIGGIAAAFLVWLTYRRPQRKVRAWIGAGAASASVAASVFVPPATNLIGLAETTHSSERATWSRLAGLESAHAKKLIGDGEFAERLQTDVLNPLNEIIETSSSWASNRTQWIAKEHHRLETAFLRLTILKEILHEREMLVEAESSPDETSRSAKLDEFWSSFPGTKKQVTRFALDEKIRDAAGYDLALLHRTATDLEIWSLEAALVELRDQVNEENPRLPASTLPWGEIRERWLARRARLDRLSPDSLDQEARVHALKERLARAIEAIE